MIYCIILQHRSFGKWSLFVHGSFDLSVYIRITENSLNCMNVCDIEQKNVYGVSQGSILGIKKDKNLNESVIHNQADVLYLNIFDDLLVE